MHDVKQAQQIIKVTIQNSQIYSYAIHLLSMYMYTRKSYTTGLDRIACEVVSNRYIHI